MTELAATLNGDPTQESGASADADAATAVAEAAAAAVANATGEVGTQAGAAVADDGKGKSVSVTVATVDRSAVLARVDGLAKRIAGAKQGGPKAYQIELARATSFLPRLRQAGNDDLIDQAEIALGALLSEPASMVLAAQTHDSIGRTLWLRAYNPATQMMVSVAILSYFFAFAWLIVGGKILGLDVQNLIGPAVFGWLGSVASMVTRLNRFRKVENPIIFGATRPLLGAAFGIFSYLALSSGVITIGPTGVDPKPELFIAIAFIAGFSERFVPDLIGQVEDLASTSKAEDAEASASS